MSYESHRSQPCCCNCVSHAVDLSHPLIGSHERVKAVVSGFSEHGLCEMWSRRART